MSTLTGAPYGLTETGTVYAEANARMRQAEQEAAERAASPAYRLGVAQAAIRDALLLTDPDQIHAHLGDALARIKDPEVAA